MSEGSDSSGAGGSFSQGVGAWVGAAEVYDGSGRFQGAGRDTRTVVADDENGRVTVDVTFEGPFRLSGTYAIADHGTHRVYEGPLNYGYAEALGDGLIAAHNYWPDLGLSQRFFLMVLPDGNRQLSLALISRGEDLRHVVVGEYQRQAEGHAQALVTAEPNAVADDPSGGGGEVLLHRPGRWTGSLTVLNGSLSPGGTTPYSETVAPSDDGMQVRVTNTGFATDATYGLETDGLSAWTPPGDVVGSYSLSGARALSAMLHHHGEGLRVWRREVASRDGTMKGVVHTWYRGEERVGVAHGTLAFESHDD